MDEILSIYKPIGLTPFQLIQQLKIKKPIYHSSKIGYAGRLDPLAHGVMLLTIGEENKNREKFLNLDKEYKFSVLLGVGTDSYDYLGFLNSPQIQKNPNNLEQKINDFIQKNIGSFKQPYPPFSSKPVNGIPLYRLAKQGRIAQTTIPTKEVKIYDLKLLSIESKTTLEIKADIIQNLKKIRGHFRQTKTISKWHELFKNNPDHLFTLAHFYISCSSSTYVRSLAYRLGQELGTEAIAYEIYRTMAGEYSVENSIKLP